jgi:hypothetical protein
MNSLANGAVATYENGTMDFEKSAVERGSRAMSSWTHGVRGLTLDVILDAG